MSDVSRIVGYITRLIDAKVEKALARRPQSSTAEVVGTGTDGKLYVRLAGAETTTPVRRSSVDVSAGDTVNVVISNGRAEIDRNLSDPSASRSSVIATQATANDAMDRAGVAGKAAGDAQASANAAAEQAAVANVNANNAIASAGAAASAASSAERSAAIAADEADNAKQDAAQASRSAQSAHEAATSAGIGLSEVERVVGTLNWISEHGTFVAATETEPVASRVYYEHTGAGTTSADYTAVTEVPYTYALTEDAAIDQSKTYYQRTGSGTSADPYVYTAVESPVAEDIATYYERHQSPAASGLYYLVVDESVQNYIAQHLALTNEGLHVMTDPTYSLTADTAIDSSKVYYARTQAASGAFVYTVVENPVAAELPTYYEKSLGYRVRIDSDSLDVLDADGAVVATFGAGGTVIGKSDGPHVEVTPSGIDFWYGPNSNAANRVGYIATTAEDSMFYMTKAVVVKDLRFGSWMWKERDSDHSLYLKWIGSDA